MAVTHLRIVGFTKVGTVLNRVGADLFNSYNDFSVTQMGAKIIKFKVDPDPKNS